jgi:hypothetical protein
MSRSIILLGGALGVAAFCSCDTSTPRPAVARASTRKPAAPALSPAETTLQLHAFFKDRKYGEIARLICEEQRGSMIDLLIATDAVLSSNLKLRVAAERRYGGPMSETWSIGELSNNLGPFSKDIKIIDQEIMDDGGVTVLLQEGEHVPLYRAEFVQRNARWYFRPEPVSRAMVAEVQRLKSILSRVADQVEQGAEFDFYLNAFAHDVYPQMRRIVTVSDGPELASGDENSQP